jgi:hypothetical protein
MFHFLPIKSDVFHVCLQENNNFKNSSVITSSIIREQEMPDERWDRSASWISMSIVLTPLYDRLISSDDMRY